MHLDITYVALPSDAQNAFDTNALHSLSDQLYAPDQFLNYRYLSSVISITLQNLNYRSASSTFKSFFYISYAYYQLLLFFDFLLLLHYIHLTAFFSRTQEM